MYPALLPLYNVYGPNKIDQRLTNEKTRVATSILIKYRVILKKVSFCIFRIILVSKEENEFTTESKDKVLSLSKFS